MSYICLACGCFGLRPLIKYDRCGNEYLLCPECGCEMLEEEKEEE